MARIANVNIPDQKRVVIALTYVHGIGPTKAENILNQMKLQPSVRVKDLTEQQLTQIREMVEKDEVVEGKLRQVINSHIKRLIEIGSYRGLRHRRSLPVRGQRTKTNARTKKARKGRTRF